MSVINKMLQDLQQRQASAIAPAPLGFEPVGRGSSSSKIFWYLMPLLLLAVCWWYWATMRHAPAADVSAPPVLVTIAEAAQASSSLEVRSVDETGLKNDSSLEVRSVDETGLKNDSSLEVRSADETGLKNDSSLEVRSADETRLKNDSSLEVHSADQARLKNSSEHSEVAEILALPKPADSASAALPITGDSRSQQLTSPPVAPSSLTIEAAPMPLLQQEYELALSAAATQQWQQALAYLSAEGPVTAFPAYFALKAAVLQQQAEWAAALTLYRQLLLVEPTHAGWNLAAGISAQQLSAEEVARGFYSIAWHHRAELPAASQAFLQQQLSQMKP